VTNAAVLAPHPFELRLLPPDLVPDRHTVRAPLGQSLLAGLADYAQRAATLSHRQSAAALRVIHGQLAVSDRNTAGAAASATPSVPDGSVADDEAHDRYFRICRAQESDGARFLGTIVTAATMFHAEMESAYGWADAERFAAVGAGLAALLGQIAGVHLAPVEHAAAATPTMPAKVDPMERWVLGHQIFAALTQAIVFALQDFEVAACGAEAQRARDALTLAADLLMASATAFQFTADFPPSAYRDVVRPSMMAERVGAGFSGLLSADHRQLVAVLTRIRPRMSEAVVRFAAQHQRLTRALNHVYENHKFVCAQFDGASEPSLRCPNSRPLPGVEELDRYQRARGRLLRPGAECDEPLIL
jgi:hypothetical protein